MGGYLPAKTISKEKSQALVRFLREATTLPQEYIDVIEKTGTLPGYIETNDDGWSSQPWFEAWLERMPPKKRANPFQGAKERRRVPLDPDSKKKSINPHWMKPSDAETIAGAMAILNGNVERDSIDLVLSHSQVPDFSLPQNASLIQDKLGLKNAGAYAIDTCCSSFVTMIEIAASLVTMGVKSKVLIVSSYLDSHVVDKSDYFSVNTGDAAIAAIISQVEPGFGYVSSHSTSHGSRHDGIIYERRSPRLHKQIGVGSSYSKEFTTFYNQEACKEIAVNAEEDMVYVVQRALEKAKAEVSDVDLLVTHQPVAWAGEAWRRAIGVPPERFYETYEAYGNIATCAAATNLLEALEADRVKAGDLLLIASSGAGENHIAVLERASPQLIQSCRGA
ncbi:hypothetical protein KKF91_06000 [Myxococcota bacterium]|nr:hypothetical protein [Myxococcota bacterium]